MTLSTRARLAGGALSVITAGTAVVTAAQEAVDARTSSAYGISATGAAPLAATPIARSTDGRLTTADGTARSSDGSASAGAATVTAGRGTASATVTGFSAFDGLVRASRVTASCDNGVVTSRADGPRPGPVGRKGAIAYAVTRTNDDGSTTIVGMQVRVTGAGGVPAATINVASAPCAGGLSPSSPPTSTPASRPPVSTSPRPSPSSARPTSTASHTSRPPTTTPTTLAPVPPNPPVAAPPGAAPVNPTAQPLPDSRRLTPAPRATPRKTHAPVTG